MFHLAPQQGDFVRGQVEEVEDAVVEFRLHVGQLPRQPRNLLLPP